MAKATIKAVKQLRELTGAGILEVRQALDEVKGDMTKAKLILKKKGLKKASKRADKKTGEGYIFSYVHQGRVGALVKIKCETDFVAKSDDFQKLGKELVLQVVSMNPKNTAELLKQDYIRDSRKTIGDLIKETIARVKENVKVDEVVRLEL